MKTKIVSQRMLSAECWFIQVWGKEACKSCEYYNTKECGGKQILITGKNTLGIKIPLPDAGEICKSK
ncbi:MAG: hypothetical protein JXB24_10320 [Bacteroidales bacterium]|nr:hypothetical protein [Bacteroidales bacterium]